MKKFLKGMKGVSEKSIGKFYASSPVIISEGSRGRSLEEFLREFNKQFRYLENTLKQSMANFLEKKLDAFLGDFFRNHRKHLSRELYKFLRKFCESPWIVL